MSVVQLAVGQVTLHQVHVLLAGGARAAGGPVGALLRQAARGALLTLQGMGWGQGRQPFGSRTFPVSLLSCGRPPSVHSANRSIRAPEGQRMRDSLRKTPEEAQKRKDLLKLTESGWKQKKSWFPVSGALSARRHLLAV